MFGEMARQAELMEAAGEDVYDSPGDGKLEDQQVEDYIKVLKKTRSMHESYADSMEKMIADAKAKEDAGKSVSAADLSRMYTGVGTAVGVHNAEMEIVKTGGGNWAEHEWVKLQLRAARLQQGEGNEANEHNYELYLKYEEDLQEIY